ncbi:UNVERIFIED_CONTAM: helix-turn-helix domain-containing protein, partial [Bacteroidetes bacterium 56_B9]
LIRYPHAGTFEIPELTVNNRTREARNLMQIGRGGTAPDAVVIHPKVAQRLSGADFDGDAVVVIPNGRREIRSTPALEKLKSFDPQSSYGPYDGMKTIDGGTYNAATKKVDYGKNAD